jgi:hypothetical protein
VRDPRKFRKLLRDAIKLNLRYRREWGSLASEYRAALPRITSIDRWRATIEGSAAKAGADTAAGKRPSSAESGQPFGR